MILYPVPFPETYTQLLQTLLRAPEEKNERTGRMIAAIPGGASFKLDLSDGKIPVCGVRKLFPKTAAAETAWYLKGEKDVTWLRKYAPIWDKFVEEDGVTVDSAYGHRWRTHFGRDQLMDGVDALEENPSDRRIFISAWDPGKDGLGRPRQKNVPCPVGFTLSITDEAVHSSLFIRSSDVFVGLPYDVMGHALLMDAIGVSLERELGTMHVTLAHPHLYDSHYDMAEAALMQDTVDDRPDQVGWTMEEIIEQPDAYVEAVALEAKAVKWPAFSPRPDVVA